MKLTTLALSLVPLATAASTSKHIKPGALNPFGAEARIDCKVCFEHVEFCITNGRTIGQWGCDVTCHEHVCHENPECKECNDNFKRYCHNRYQFACNGPC